MIQQFVLYSLSQEINGVFQYVICCLQILRESKKPLDMQGECVCGGVG